MVYYSVKRKKKIILTLFSKNSKNFTVYCLMLKSFLIFFGIFFSFLNVPRKKKILNLLRAPHIHKKAGRSYVQIEYKGFFIFQNLKILLFLNFISFFFNSSQIYYSLHDEIID